MTTTELARLVSKMRQQQREYLRTRSATALEKSKRLEKRVDRCCARILDGQRNLFDAQPGSE